MQKKRFRMICRSQEANRRPSTFLKMQIMRQKKSQGDPKTGILIFCNQAPVMWLGKKQNSFETLTFASEFTALKLAVELVIALQYKLRMFGVPLKGPTDMFCDNKAVINNTSTQKSVLCKKHQSIAYHKCREAVAALICRIRKEDTESNLADMFTKILGRTRR